MSKELDSTSEIMWMGDRGVTNLLTQRGLSKTSLPILALGETQAVGASIGLARAALDAAKHADLRCMLLNIQRDLYVISCDVAEPTGVQEVSGRQIPRAGTDLVRRLDADIEHLEALAGIKTDRFLIEGGSIGAALLFVANARVRETERFALALKAEGFRPLLMGAAAVYFNHLSWCLYVMAYLVNRREGVTMEVVWVDPTTGAVRLGMDEPQPSIQET